MGRVNIQGLEVRTSVPTLGCGVWREGRAGLPEWRAKEHRDAFPSRVGALDLLPSSRAGPRQGASGGSEWHRPSLGVRASRTWDDWGTGWWSFLDREPGTVAGRDSLRR